mgnify:CR=1 FL=1
MEYKFKPFGIRYDGNSVSINLRIHPEKFKKMNIPNHIGNWRYSKNGYVLFEATLDTKTEEYVDVISKINAVR